jgi:hypothetical protein
LYPRSAHALPAPFEIVAEFEFALLRTPANVQCTEARNPVLLLAEIPESRIDVRGIAHREIYRQL